VLPSVTVLLTSHKALLRATARRISSTSSSS